MSDLELMSPWCRRERFVLGVDPELTVSRPMKIGGSAPRISLPALEPLLSVTLSHVLRQQGEFF
jgi:hypothetical protein